MSKIDAIKSWIGMTIGISSYIAWIPTVYFILFGGTTIRTIIGIILIYQYFFATKSDLFRSFMGWLKPYNYFNSTNIIVEEELRDNKCLFGFHPHGVGTMGFSFSSFLNETLNKTVLGASRVMTTLPISGLFSKLLGATGVNPKNFVSYMKKGKLIKIN